jgi:hypothetical protein
VPFHLDFFIVTPSDPPRFEDFLIAVSPSTALTRFSTPSMVLRISLTVLDSTLCCSANSEILASTPLLNVSTVSLIAETCAAFASVALFRVSEKKPFKSPNIFAKSGSSTSTSDTSAAFSRISAEASAATASSAGAVSTGVASATAAGAYVVAIPHLVPIEAAPRRIVLKSLENVSVALLKDKFSR